MRQSSIRSHVPDSGLLDLGLPDWELHDSELPDLGLPNWDLLDSGLLDLGLLAAASSVHRCQRHKLLRLGRNT